MTKQATGVLILHGFTDTIHSVRILESPVVELGLPYRIPVLRGHGKDSPEALQTVGWQDWVNDARLVMDELLGEVNKVIVIGFSMGGLIGIKLTAERLHCIDSLVLLAVPAQLHAPIAPGRPFHFLAPVLMKMLRKWPMIPVYADRELAKEHDSYAWVPIGSIQSLFDLSAESRKSIKDILVPTLILQSRKDITVKPESAEIIYNEIATPAGEKKIIWFQKSGHQMLRDCEKDRVAREVMDYVKARLMNG